MTITEDAYLYGAANPITYSDASGLEPRPIHCRVKCEGDPRDPHGIESDGYGDADRVGSPPPELIGWTNDGGDFTLHWLASDGTPVVDFGVYTPCYYVLESDVTCDSNYVDGLEIAGFLYNFDGGVLENGTSRVASRALRELLRRGVEVGKYSAVRGHHPMSQALFQGSKLYSGRSSLSISAKGLAKLGTSHDAITQAQRLVYREYASKNTTLTLRGAMRLEIKAHRLAGMSEADARLLVRSAYDDLLRQGVTKVTHLPYTRSGGAL